MANINIGGRLHSTATGNVVAGANEILDDTKGKKQSVINQETDEALAGKQAALVSGTNIKTVNGESILGSGNIQAGDPDAIKYSSQTLTDAQKTQARTNIGAYNKPGTGIPATDLSSAAQTSLGKADTAYQKPQGGVPRSDLASGVQGSLDLADTAVQAENVGPILPPPETDEFATKTQVTQLEAKVDDLAETDLSDSIAVNESFVELYLSGVTVSNVKKITFQRSGGVMAIALKDSGGNNIVSFTGTEQRIFRATSGTSFILAVLNLDKLSGLPVSVIDISFNEERTKLSSCPLIIDYLTHANERVVIPSYTETSSKRINTSGEVVSANSNWFYTSPIQMKVGDVLYFRSDGNVNASPICETDANASSYTPVASYGGTDPSDYFFIATKDTYLTLSGIHDGGMRLFVSIIKNDYINGLLTPIISDIAQCKSDISALQGGGSELTLKAVDYGFKEPQVLSGADVKSVTGWGTDNGATLATGRKYNNITRLNRPVLTITSNSGNGRAWYNLPSSVNANQYALLIEFCINYSGNTIPGNVNLELWSGTTRTSSYRASLQLQLSSNNGYYRNGWHQMCIFVPSCQGYFGTGQYFDPTAVTGVGLMLYNTNNVAYSVSVARMDFVPSMRKPGIVTIIDNFGVSVPAMADYAHSKGVRLNLSIIPGAYTGAPGAPTCASKSELDRIASQGHCIWNHTYTHQVFNNLTYKEIQDQINLAEQWMEENGFGKNCDFLSVPSASFNTDSGDAVFDSNVRLIFHNWCYNNQMVYVPYGNVMRTLPVTLLDSVATGEGKSGADIATVASKCMTYNGLSVIGFHGTYWEIDDGVSWKAYIDAIAAISNVYHYGLDELVAGRWC